MKAYIIDADIPEELYMQIETHIVGEVLDAGYISYNGEEWTPRRCTIEDAHWDDGTCTWGCICSACKTKFEHESGSNMNFCPKCGAENRR